MHLQFKIMRSETGLRDDTKMLSTAEHKMRRGQLREVPCYIQQRFEVPAQDHRVRRDEERRRLIRAGFRSRQEFVGIRRALLRVEDEENHQCMLLFVEFASSSLTMAVKFALQCSLSLTESSVSLSTSTNTQSRVLDAENAVQEQGARMQATENRLQHMELSSARRSLTENETSGMQERESAKQAVESLTTIVDDLLRRTTSERLGSVEKELQTLRACQDEIQKTYDKVLKTFQDQGPERQRWRTRRHQGVYAQPWRDGSQYYDQWRYGPGRYAQQRKRRQCYVGNTFHRQWTRKEYAEPEKGNEMFSERPWSEHKRGKRVGRRQRLEDALKVLLEALFDLFVEVVQLLHLGCCCVERSHLQLQPGAGETSRSLIVL